jgi:hypothetical protein
MNAGATNIKIGTIVAISYIKDKNDSSLNHFLGTVTNPFAFGCTDKGWIGIRCNNYTAYGYEFNVKANEVHILNDAEIEEYNKYKEMFGSNVFFDVYLKENKYHSSKNPYANTILNGVTLAPINQK